MTVDVFQKIVFFFEVIICDFKPCIQIVIPLFTIEQITAIISSGDGLIRILSYLNITATYKAYYYEDTYRSTQ